MRATLPTAFLFIEPDRTKGRVYVIRWCRFDFFWFRGGHAPLLNRRRRLFAFATEDVLFELAGGAVQTPGRLPIIYLHVGLACHTAEVPDHDPTVPLFVGDRCPLHATEPVFLKVQWLNVARSIGTVGNFGTEVKSAFAALDALAKLLQK